MSTNVICTRCNTSQVGWVRKLNGKVICKNCGRALPKEKARRVFGMKDSAGILRTGSSK